MNGLLKRHAEPTDVPSIVAILEVWNTAHPDCPIVSARRGVRLPNPAQRRCYMYENEARLLRIPIVEIKDGKIASISIVTEATA